MTSQRDSVTSGRSSDVKLEGFLTKQGKLTGSFLMKKYWCVLTDRQLSFYKNPDKSCSCGHVEVSMVQSVVKAFASKGFGFNVVSGSSSQTFVAADAVTRDKWVSALQDAMSVVGHNRDVQRWSVSGCGLLSKVRSDDDDEVALPQRCKSDFQVEEMNRSVLRESSVEDNQVGSTDPDIVDEGSESKFRYMNAADVALMSGCGGSGAARVRSVDSEDEEEEKHRVDSGEQSASTGDQDHPLRGTADPGQNMTSPTGEVPGQSAARTVDAEKTFGAVQTRSTESSTASQVPASQTPVDAGKEGGGSESGIAAEESSPLSASQAAKTANVDQVKSVKAATAPARRVTFRREVNQPVSAVPTPPVKPVIELHLDADHKPTVFSDFELDLLSSDAGSAVQKLRQFLENDDSFGTISLQSVPTAVQPGKAFDSLKYFLSTLE